MTWWWTLALAGPLCRSVAPGPLPEVVPPDAWPDPTVRCLDVGSPRETLLQRARRCVREVPEDPAPVRVLGVLGGRRDVALLEARATLGWHATEATIALGSLDHRGAREALLRVACRSAHWAAAVDVLRQDPHPREAGLYRELAVVEAPSPGPSHRPVEAAPRDAPVRARVPVRDAEGLREAVRGQGRDEDFVRAVGPWVWEGADDLGRLRALGDPWVLVDAGDPEGLEAIASDASDAARARWWSWLRGPGLEERFAAAQDVAVLATFVRPEGYERALAIVEPRADHREGGWPIYPLDRLLTVSEQRRWMHHDLRDPELSLLGAMDLVEKGVLPDERLLRRLAAHHGLRWRLLAAVHGFDDDMARAELMGTLVGADWRRQAPPESVVAAAESMPSVEGTRVLAVAGAVAPLRKRLLEGDPEQVSAARAAVEEVVRTMDPPHPRTAALLEELPVR